MNWPFVSLLALLFGLTMCLYRVFRGPTLPDRAVGLDTAVLHVIGILLVYSLQHGKTYFVDVVLAMSLVGFVGTVSIAKFIERQSILTPRSRR